MPSAAPGRPRGPVVRLSVMMFLQYAIWGAWLPLFWQFMERHRKFSPEEVGTLFGIAAAGALFAPLIAGQIADRWFATEKFLGISHLLGAVLVWQLASLTSYGWLLAFGFAYSLLYAPTLALTNSLALHHLVDRDREFPRVRLWGTIGFIAAGIGVAQWLLYRHSPEGATAAELVRARTAGIADAFKLSAGLGGALALFCFFLPHTPPQPGRERFAPGEALREVRASPALLVLFLVALPMSCVHQFYFARTSGFLSELKLGSGGVEKAIETVFGAGGGGLMTIGQFAEIAVLALMPFLLKRFSRKALLMMGVAAYILRFAIFAYAPHPALVIAGLALHGFCFGLFVFVCFLVVDEKTSSDVRASAQGLFNLILIGIGIIVGNLVAGEVGKWATAGSGAEAVVDWRRLFSVPMWAAVACLVILGAFYPRSERRERLESAS